MWRILIFSVLTALVCQSKGHSVSQTESEGASPPNIVFILADDLGWNDVSYHGSRVKTPNIDSLSKTGVRLENYYVQQVCTPSRAALMSGRYPIHTGLQHEVIYAGQRSGLPLGVKTLANQLKERGYDTHGVGKWHLGFFEESYLPTKRGFDSWTGYMTGNEDYYTHVNCESLGCGYDFYANSTLDMSDNTTYSTLRYTRRAKDIIMGHQTDGPQSKPLFLYLPFQAVHSPLQVPEEYIEPYKRSSLSPQRQKFAGMASCLDEAIGNITSYLKSKNMWENTILIFSTDNGGETNAGGNNWPLRGKKWTLWEGGVRGVSFIHSPLFNSTTVGTTHRSLMHISDWYPTILEGILSHTLPSNLSLDGVNMWSSLLAGSEGPRTELLHTIDPLASHPGVALYNDTFPTNTTAAIRVGDWKLLTGYPGVDKIFPPVNYYSDYFNYRVSNWHWKTLNKIARIKGDEANYFHLMHDNEYHDLQDRHMQGVLYENDFPEIYQLTASGEVKNVWLFNITEDPEELIDRSDDFPEIVKQLLDRLAEYNLTAIPPNFPSPDPAGSPANNGGAWKPWVNTGVVSTLINHVNSAIVRTKSFFGQLISWE